MLIVNGSFLDTLLNAPKIEPDKSSRNVGIPDRNLFEVFTHGRNQLTASDDGEMTWIAIPQLSDSSLSIRTTTPTKVVFNGLSG